MSVATTRSWATLPPELLAIVHENLAQDFLESKEHADLQVTTLRDRRPRQNRTALPPSALACAARVNKHWHAVANEYLYRAIFVHREETMQRLLASVTNNPELLVLIKFVTVDYKYNYLSMQKQAANKALAIRKKTSNLTWQFLHKLPPGRVQELDVEVASLHPFAETLGIDLPCLHGVVSLSISMNRSRFVAPFERLVRQWLEPAAPTLKRLSVDPKVVMSIADAVPDNLHINNLRLVDNGGFDGPSLRRLLSGTSLEYLTLSFLANITAPALELQGALTGIAPRLKGLHVEVRYDEFQPGAKAFVEHLATILPMCRSLRIAHFLLGEGDMENVIKYLPNTVEKVIVAVESGDWEEEVIFDVVDKEDISDVDAIAKTADAIISQDLPSLRQLMVISRASPSRQGVGAAVDLTPYEEAIAMAAAKDVELSFHRLFPTEVAVDW